MFNYEHIKKHYISIIRKSEYIFDIMRGWCSRAKNFIRNVWVFRDTLNHHRPYDYSGMLFSQKDALQDISNYGFPHLEERVAKSLNRNARVAIELIDRLLDGDDGFDKFDIELDIDEEPTNGYYTARTIVTPKYDFPVRTKMLLDIKLQQQHLNMLLEIYRKFLLRFWD